MMDQFLEQVATKRNTGMQTAMMAFAWLTMILSGFFGLMNLMSITGAFAQQGTAAGIMTLVIAVVFIGMTVLVYLYKDRIRTEYEYTFTNGSLDFAAVYNNRRRKALGTMTLKNIKACGKVASGAFNRYINMPGIKRSNWFVNREADLFFIYFEKDSVKRIVIMEPTEEMVKLIRGAVPREAYQVN